MYNDNYETLRRCVIDALGDIDIMMYDEYVFKRSEGETPAEYAVLLGQRSGSEIHLKKRGILSVSIDWTIVHIKNNEINTIIPVEVQSLDITGSYRNNLNAYNNKVENVPKSKHGMNWANVWKRLIPQLIIKGNITKRMDLCSKGIYFIVPDRVFNQFEKILGTSELNQVDNPGSGSVTIYTYSLGKRLDHGNIRELIISRLMRFKLEDITNTFGKSSALVGMEESMMTSVHKQINIISDQLSFDV